jgi:hypothetical protein
MEVMEVLVIIYLVDLVLQLLTELVEQAMGVVVVEVKVPELVVWVQLIV